MLLKGRKNYLRPFTLSETEQFLRSKGIDWEKYLVTEVYMTMGGIPYYIDMLEGSMSLNENIDHLFFEEGAALRMEYDFIFRSLFRDSKVYRSVVELLATRSSGMSRKDIQDALKMDDGGLLTEVLDNLCKCDFLRQYEAFGKNGRGQMLHHISQIKQKLGISGVLSKVCSWSCKAFTDKDGTRYKGTQIDLMVV